MLRKGVPVAFVRMCELLLRGHYCEMDFTNGNFEAAATAAAAGAASGKIENRKGAIQGSISGPMFWSVFINDLIEQIESRQGVARVEEDGVARSPLARGVSPPGSTGAVLSSSWFADDASLLEHRCDTMSCT